RRGGCGCPTRRFGEFTRTSPNRCVTLFRMYTELRHGRAVKPILKATAPILAAAGLSAALVVSPFSAASAQTGSVGSAHTLTPIKHLVIIFQENVSFDHYFGTYPNAANTGGQPFTASPGTPSVNGLLTPAPGGGSLLTNNPNGANPLRYDPTNIND